MQYYRLIKKWIYNEQYPREFDAFFNSTISIWNGKKNQICLNMTKDLEDPMDIPDPMSAFL